MKNKGKLLFGIFLIAQIIVFIVSIYHDISTKGMISSHTIVVFSGVLVFISVIIQMKNELSESEFKRYIILFFVILLIVFILFKIGIIP